MLAYVFWHRPGVEIDSASYEEAQRSFHAALGIESASFRLATLPFESVPGYEDWYLVEDWRALGELNETAVDAMRRGPHDHAASASAKGWGSVYALVKGPATIPHGIEWFDKPRGASSVEFAASLPGEIAWRRQLALGPGPEFCASAPESASRERVLPDAS